MNGKCCLWLPFCCARGHAVLWVSQFVWMSGKICAVRRSDEWFNAVWMSDDWDNTASMSDECESVVWIRDERNAPQDDDVMNQWEVKNDQRRYDGTHECCGFNGHWLSQCLAQSFGLCLLRKIFCWLVCRSFVWCSYKDETINPIVLVPIIIIMVDNNINSNGVPARLLQ